MKRYEILTAVGLGSFVLVGILLLLNTSTGNETGPAPAVSARESSPERMIPAKRQAPLPITLPRPQFEGTPPNLEGIPQLTEDQAIAVDQADGTEPGKKLRKSGNKTRVIQPAGSRCGRADRRFGRVPLQWKGTEERGQE